MRKGILFCLCIWSLCSFEGKTQDVVNLDSIRAQFEQESRQVVDDFEDFSEAAYEEYAAYEAAARVSFSDYLQSIQAVWGANNVAIDTRSVWVEYNDDYHSRSLVDFDKGTVTVEITLDKNASQADEQSRLTEAIYQVLTSRGSTCPYPSSVDVSQPLTERPILEGLIDFSRYQTNEDAREQEYANVRGSKKAPPQPKVKGKELSLNTTPRNTASTSSKTTMAQKAIKAREAQVRRNDSIAAATRRMAEAIYLQSVKDTLTLAKSDTQEATVTEKEEEETVTVVKVEIALVTDNLSKSATLYKDLISEFSTRFQVEEPLIYAIMEQESSFNPQATSYVPAYGLMQLVPKSGGAHAYQYVYNKEWIPTQSYLYVPRNNIELGTAYLRVLNNQFAKVTRSDCRRLCVIASYNTGAGNVSRAFTGNTKLSGALGLIESYSYDQLYTHLSTKLNTSEARNYVVKVTKRREKYLK